MSEHAATNPSSLRPALIAIWLLACVAVLAFAYANRQYPDTDLFFVYAMLALTFPSGLIVAALVAVLGAYDVTTPGGFVGSLIMWPLLVCVGYVQWFALVPRLARRIRGA